MANNLTGRSKLYPGQRLVIPWSGKLPPSALRKAASVASANNRKPKPVAKTPARSIAKSAAAARLPSRTVLTARIGNVPNDPSGNPKALALSNKAFSNMAPSTGKVQASQFQELRIVNYNSKHKYGEVISAYGESLGKYADWAEVSVSDLRGLNQMSLRARLYPGRTISIPLHVVSKDTFGERRWGFHIEREATFLAEYDITSMRKVKVRPGQSPWNIAQTNNVPMWLFYRENPALIDKPMMPGMNVILPVVREGGPVAGRNNAR
jgi:LysM repeat protein